MRDGNIYDIFVTTGSNTSYLSEKRIIPGVTGCFVRYILLI